MKYKIGDKILYIDDTTGIRRIDNIVDIIESKFLSGKPKHDSIQYVIGSSLILREDKIISHAESDEKMRSECKKMKYKIGDTVEYRNEGKVKTGVIKDVMAAIGVGGNDYFYTMHDGISYVYEGNINGYAPPKDPSGLQKSEARPIENDPVNNPQHYTQGAVECIDAMQSALSHEQFIGYLKGQIIKYTWRCDHKANSIQDIEKAIWYAKKLVEVLKNEAL